MSMLDVKDLHVSYGAIAAVRGVTFNLEEGEIVSLIGANGAGKSTILRTISGLVSPKSGSITFNGTELTKTAAHKIVGLGIAHVPEGRHVFSGLTVLENLKLGATLQNDTSVIEERLKSVFSMFPRLEERTSQKAGTLSGGEQQMLALGRAIMTEGKLMLLDEPSMGLAPIIVEEIFETIYKINKSGTSILLIEQNANLALEVSSRAYVLENGLITIEGISSELIVNERVINAYLGA